MTSNNHITTDSALRRHIKNHKGAPIELAYKPAGRPTGLRIRIAARKVTFRWYTKDAATKKRKVITLGEYPDMSLSGATAALKEMQNTRNVIGALPSELTVTELVQEHLGVTDVFTQPIPPKKLLNMKTKEPLRARARVVRALQEVVTTLGHIKARQLDAVHILDVAQVIHQERGVQPTKDFVFAINRVYDWAVAVKKVRRNPAVDVNLSKALNVKTTSTARQRCPTPAELAALLDLLNSKHCPLDERTALAIQIIVHLGIRREELVHEDEGEAQWSEVNFLKREWTVPAKRCKNGKPTTHPLPDTVVKLFNRLHAIWEARGRKDGLLSGMNRNVIGRGLKRLQLPRGGKSQDKIVLWDTGGDFVQPHDFRRSFRSYAASLKLGDEKTIKAQMGQEWRTGTDENYDQRSLRAPRRELLALWAECLTDPVGTLDADAVA